MIKFLLWCVLFILCWPVALFALVLYPIVWLLLLPFRLLGIAVHGVLDLVAALLFCRRACCAQSRPPVSHSRYSFGIAAAAALLLKASTSEITLSWLRT